MKYYVSVYKYLQKSFVMQDLHSEQFWALKVSIWLYR